MNRRVAGQIRTHHPKKIQAGRGIPYVWMISFVEANRIAGPYHIDVLSLIGPDHLQSNSFFHSRREDIDLRDGVVSMWGETRPVALFGFSVTRS